jgi:folate-binding protein YgfZ
VSEDSYGDVTGEYQALHDGAGVVEGRHELIRVAGADAGTFLDSLLSQDLAGMQDGAVVRSLLLEPRGKLRALLWVSRVDDEFLLICDTGASGAVGGDLTRFKLRVDVSIGEPEPVTDLIGPAAGNILTGLEAHEAVSAPLGSLDRWFVIAPPVTGLTGAGAARCGQLAYTAARVEQGEPVIGVDVDDSTIPQEAGVVPEAVSFTKGCYLGQELVARIDSRGHVNRHLRGLVLTENALPPAGAEVVADDKVVGTITSVSESLLLGAPIGLGLIRREVNPGDRVQVRWPGGSAGAEVRQLPLIPA